MVNDFQKRTELHRKTIIMNSEGAYEQIHSWFKCRFACFEYYIRPTFLIVLRLTHIEKMLNILLLVLRENFFENIEMKTKKILIEFLMLSKCEWVVSNLFYAKQKHPKTEQNVNYKWCSELCTLKSNWWLLTRWQLFRTLFLEFQMQCAVLSGISFQLCC